MCEDPYRPARKESTRGSVEDLARLRWSGYIEVMANDGGHMVEVGNWVVSSKEEQAIVSRTDPALASTPADRPTVRYGARTDCVIYEHPATADYLRADWIRLALAALDQAGVSPCVLSQAHHLARGYLHRTLVELDAACTSCGADCDTDDRCPGCLAEEEQAMPVWEKLSECVSVTDCGVSIDDPECGRVRVSLVDSEDERGPGDDEIAALLHGRLGNRWHRVTDWSRASLEPDVSSIWEVWS